MSIKSRIVLASAVSLLILGACNSKTGNAPAVGDIAATVNGMPISKYSVDQIAAQRAAMGQPDSPEFVWSALCTDHASFHIPHSHEPLLGQIRLDGGLRAIRVTELHLAVLDGIEEALRLEVFNHPPAGG